MGEDVLHLDEASEVDTELRLPPSHPLPQHPAGETEVGHLDAQNVAPVLNPFMDERE